MAAVRELRERKQGPVEWLERTMRALAVMDAAKLERLRDEVEASGDTPVRVALEGVRRAAHLQQALEGLLRSTEEGLQVLRGVSARGEGPWAH